MIAKKNKSRSVTTVMQPSQKGQPLVLPNTITDDSTERTKPNELVVFLFNSDDNVQLLSIDQKNHTLDHAELALNDAVSAMKANQNFPQKAILRIDKNTKMSAVNHIKELLQKKEILKIEYVHRKG